MNIKHAMELSRILENDPALLREIFLHFTDTKVRLDRLYRELLNIDLSETSLSVTEFLEKHEPDSTSISAIPREWIEHVVNSLPLKSLMDIKNGNLNWK